MESIFRHLEENYQRYDKEVNFSIFDIHSSTYLNLGIKPLVECETLPEVLEDNTLYLYSNGENDRHCIFHYSNGIIFNPSTKYYPLNREDLYNVCESEFEPSDGDYQKFWDFIGMTRNLSGMMSCLTIEKNCEMWCLLIQYLHNNNMSFHAFEEYMDIYGPYRNMQFNKLHYLCIFITYVHIINEDAINFEMGSSIVEKKEIVSPRWRYKRMISNNNV